MPLRSLIYVSSATHLFSQGELRTLLEISRHNNARDGVTGMLLYKNGNFMQAIEGEEEAVRRVHNRILQDPRHHGLITLLDRVLPQREFPEWQMGFQNLADPELATAPGFSEFLRLPLAGDELVVRPSRALKLLRTFRQKM